MGLFVPSDLVRMSLIPASSMTARMAPPEITPVPGAAGLSRILAAPHLNRTSCGMVVPTIGTVTMLRLAISTPLRIASGTSLALPRPATTRPFWSPTTMRAENENRRPPFSTLATRFRLTTRSATSLRSPYVGYRDAIRLKLQSGLAGGFRKRLDAAVVQEPTPIEDHRAHAGGLRALGDRAADCSSCLGVILADLQLGGRRRCHRAAGLIVDQLGVYMVQTAVHAEPGPLACAGHLNPHAAMPPGARRLPIELLQH